jgi:hypothetical protein
MIDKGRKWFFKGALRFPQAVHFPLLGSGAPTNGTSGTGAAVAGKGSIYIDYAAGAIYANTGTKASPTWTLNASTAGAITPTSIVSSGKIVSSSPAAAGGVGYATGAGGTATQTTNRSTGVTVSPNPCLSGTITTDTTSLAAEASATFTVTNSGVAIGDVVVVSIQSGSNGGGTSVSVSTVAAGSFAIRVTNNNASGGTAETGAIIINFAVIKAVSA